MEVPVTPRVPPTVVLPLVANVVTVEAPVTSKVPPTVVLPVSYTHLTLPTSDLV